MMNNQSLESLQVTAEPAAELGKNTHFRDTHGGNQTAATASRMRSTTAAAAVTIGA
jgi:hypothetical protein